MSDATNEAVLKLYDHIERISKNLHVLLDLHAVNKERIAALEEDAASLRDFVHGLNDRHTSLELGLRETLQPWRDAYPEGAIAPVAEVSDRDS